MITNIKTAIAFPMGDSISVVYRLTPMRAMRTIVCSSERTDSVDTGFLTDSLHSPPSIGARTPAKTINTAAAMITGIGADGPPRPTTRPAAASKATPALIHPSSTGSGRVASGCSGPGRASADLASASSTSVTRDLEQPTRRAISLALRWGSASAISRIRRAVGSSDGIYLVLVAHGSQRWAGQSSNATPARSASNCTRSFAPSAIR